MDKHIQLQPNRSDAYASLDVRVADVHPIVLDTSFLISLGRLRPWALMAYHALSKEGTVAIIPATVKKEYEDHVSQKTFRRGMPLATFDDITKLLGFNYLSSGVKNVFVKEDLLADQKAIALSFTDFDILNTVVGLSYNTRKVSVASKDRALVDKVEEFKSNEHVHIDIYSPRSHAFKEIGSAMNIRFLVLEDVIQTLFQSKGDEQIRPYLFYAPDLYVNGHKCDVVFGVYNRDSVTQPIPHIEGARSMPLTVSEKETLPKAWSKSLATKYSAMYFKPYPNIIGIAENTDPFTESELVRFMNPRAQRKADVDRVNNTLFNIHARAVVDGISSPSAENTLRNLRQQLGSYQ